MLQALSLSENAAILAVAIGVIAAAVVGYRVWRQRNTPAEKERRRRLHVHEKGRVVDGNVTDVSERKTDVGSETLIYYRYTIAGVEYSAAQDVSTLLDEVGDPWRFMGPVTVKYIARVPTNSIIICEEWSGMRGPSGS